MTTSTTPQQTTDLQRPIEGRIIAGVAAGLGQRFSINPWWFRVALILMTLFGGFGLVLYAIGWLLIPAQGSDDSIMVRWVSEFDTSNTPMVIGMGLMAVAALILVAGFDLVSGNLLVAAILFVIGVLLYRGDIGGSDQPEDPNHGGGDVPEDTIEESTTAIALEEPGTGGGDPPQDVYPTLPQEPPPKEAKPRSILGRLTFAATLIAVGALALLDAAGILFPGFVHYVAVALGVVGVGLIVGTFIGRARWLIAVGLLLVPVLQLLAGVVPIWSFTGEAGDVYYTVTSTQEIDDQYEIAAGTLYLDLTSLAVEPGAARREFAVSVGAGEIRIDVPTGVPVRVDAEVGIGMVRLFGDERVGIGVDSSAATGSPAVLIIHAEAGVGAIVVREVEVAEG